MIQRIQGALDGIADSTIFIQIPAGNRFFRSHLLKALCADVFPLAVHQSHSRFLVFRRAFQAHRVFASRKPKAHGTSGFFVKFRNENAVFIPDKNATIHILIQFQPRAGAAQIRHHHVARAHQIHIPAGVLSAAHGGFRFQKGFVKSELVSFGKGHFPIAARIPCTAKPAHQRMGKEGALQLVAFLAGFVLGAAGNKSVALHITALVHHKSGNGNSALGPDNRSRAARIDNRNFHVGTQGIHPFAKFAPHIKFRTQAESLFVGVAAVIHQHFVPAAIPLCLANHFVQLVKAGVQLGKAGFVHQKYVFLGNAAQFLEHRSKSLSVAFSIAQGGAVLAAVVRADGEDVAFNGSGRIRRKSRNAENQKSEKTKKKRIRVARKIFHGGFHIFLEKVFHGYLLFFLFAKGERNALNFRLSKGFVNIRAIYRKCIRRSQ